MTLSHNTVPAFPECDRTNSKTTPPQLHLSLSKNSPLSYVQVPRIQSLKTEHPLGTTVHFYFSSSEPSTTPSGFNQTPGLSLHPEIFPCLTPKLVFMACVSVPHSVLHFSKFSQLLSLMSASFPSPTEFQKPFAQTTQKLIRNEMRPSSNLKCNFSKRKLKTNPVGATLELRKTT